MNLESLVCNLELSKKLEKLGMKQESFFWWIFPESKDRPMIIFGEDLDAYRYTNHGEFYSAFTSGELGEIIVESKYQLPVYAKRENWFCAVNGLPLFESNTEANVRAKMLIYLIEEKILKVENTNLAGNLE